MYKLWKKSFFLIAPKKEMEWWMERICMNSIYKIIMKS